MLIIPPESIALVTGVTGYIAAHVAEHLLEAGFRVRGTARDAEKAKHLTDRFGERFEIAIVKDMQTEDAFNKAVEGCDFVHHVASPFHTKAQDPYKDMIDPAVKGTINLLKAVKNHGSARRVILTSSVASIMDTSRKDGHLFTEADWNELDPKQVDDAIAKKEKPAGDVIYRASKSLAEKAAWDFVKNEKATFELVVTNPVYVFGPTIHKIKRAEEINTSVSIIYAIANGQINKPAGHSPFSNYVDVRDVAVGHVRASLEPEAAGKRFILSGGAFSQVAIAQILHSKFPEFKKVASVSDAKETLKTDVSNQSARDLLKIEFKSLEESVVDTVNSIKEFL